MRTLMCFATFGVLIALSCPLEAPAAAHYSHDVYQAQVKLKDIGYDPGPCDGFWGTQVESAVRAFQKDRGLSITGKLDAPTRNELGLPEAQTPTHSIQRTIGDAARLKLIMLDLDMNLLGVGWEDRDRSGIGRRRYQDSLSAITARYHMNIDKVHGYLDVTSVGGFPTGIFADAQSDWVHLLRLEDSGSLPTVEFRSGRISLSFAGMSVGFSGGTECLIDGKVYIWRDRGWVSQETASPAQSSQTSPTPEKRAAGEKEATGTLSPRVNVRSPDFQLITLEEVKGAFFILNRDWLAWDCDALRGKKVRLTYKTVKDADAGGTMDVVTHIERVE